MYRHKPQGLIWFCLCMLFFSQLHIQTLTINTGALRDVFSPHCSFSLLPQWLHSKDPLCQSSWSLQIDTTVHRLIKDRDESAYRQEVEQLAIWCSHNNLELNTLKTVEMIVDFRRNPPAFPPLTIMDSTVAAVESFKFLGNHHLPGPEVGQSHWLYCEKGPAEAVFPPPAKEPATGAAWNSSTLPSSSLSCVHL